MLQTAAVMMKEKKVKIVSGRLTKAENQDASMLLETKKKEQTLVSMLLVFDMQARERTLK